MSMSSGPELPMNNDDFFNILENWTVVRTGFGANVVHPPGLMEVVGLSCVFVEIDKSTREASRIIWSNNIRQAEWITKRAMATYESFRLPQSIQEVGDQCGINLRIFPRTLMASGTAFICREFAPSGSPVYFLLIINNIQLVYRIFDGLPCGIIVNIEHPRKIIGRNDFKSRVMSMVKSNV